MILQRWGRSQWDYRKLHITVRITEKDDVVVSGVKQGVRSQFRLFLFVISQKVWVSLVYALNPRPKEPICSFQLCRGTIFNCRDRVRHVGLEFIFAPQSEGFVVEMFDNGDNTLVAFQTKLHNLQ